MIQTRERFANDVIVFNDYRQVDHHQVTVSNRTGSVLIVVRAEHMKYLKSELQIQGKYAFDTFDQANEYAYQLLLLLEGSTRGDESYRPFLQSHFSLS